MLQKITDMWPNLLRKFQHENDESQLEREGLKSDEEGLLLDIDVDEDQINMEYKNLFWTRLMIIDGFEQGQERKWPLGPDLIEECQAVANLPAVDPDDWKPLFEPTDYNEAHGPLEIEGNKLSSEEMLSWAERAVQIRESITLRSKQYVANQDEEGLQEQPARSQKGLKKSKRSHNPSGKSEADLKKIRDSEKVKCRHFKKRHRKDLSPDEIDQIVEATKRPFCMLKYVALQFQITRDLVSSLAKEALKNPEKLEKHRLRASLH